MPTIIEYINSLPYPEEVRRMTLRAYMIMPYVPFSRSSVTNDSQITSREIEFISNLARETNDEYERNKRQEFIEQQKEKEKQKKQKEVTDKMKKYSEAEYEKISYSPKEIRDKPLLRFMKHLHR
jgi:uncharacterized membrane protein YgaE (UPF0421/DUF939 family)